MRKNGDPQQTLHRDKFGIVYFEDVQILMLTDGRMDERTYLRMAGQRNPLDEVY